MSQPGFPAPPGAMINNGTAMDQPQIYTAIYSGVSVYEMEIRGIAVMRRRADSWLNATQILKVAGVDKGKRTKVLEKEILTGPHEKVQGGYGKYQGTWVDYQRGVEFCRQYHVEELLRPLLLYDMGQDGVNAAGQGVMETPTKEQAMAAQRKRRYTATVDNRPASRAANGTFFSNISSTASTALAAIGKAQLNPGQRPGAGASEWRPGVIRQPSQQYLPSQESFMADSQQSTQTVTSGSNPGLDPALDSAYGTQMAAHFGGPSSYPQNGEGQERARKRIRHDLPGPSQDTIYDVAMTDGTPTEPNHSFVSRPDLAQPNAGEEELALAPLSPPESDAGRERLKLLVNLFVEPDSQSDTSRQEALCALSGVDYDTPVDNDHHNTALHWAAALGHLALMRRLIAGGASIFRVNLDGQSPLMRACSATNNFDRRSFPGLLELLGPTIEMRDHRGRTVLHQIVVTSAIESRSQAAKYYLESILEFVVRQGSAPNSQPSSFVANGHAPLPPINIARFMLAVVNAQDKSGDTALNIAARTGNTSIIQQLLEVGADVHIPNRMGLRPLDFGIGNPDEEPRPVENSQHAIGYGDAYRAPPKSFAKEMNQQALSYVSSCLAHAQAEHEKEERDKEAAVGNMRIELRKLSAVTKEARQRLGGFRKRRERFEERKLQAENLQRAIAEMHLKLINAGIDTGNLPMSDRDVPCADGEMLIVSERLPPVIGGNNNVNNDTSKEERLEDLTPNQLQYISSLAPVHVLEAQVAAYRTNLVDLNKYLEELQHRSAWLENMYRRAACLCTGIQEPTLGERLQTLIASLESEGRSAIETDKLGGFLGKVDEAEAA